MHGIGCAFRYIEVHLAFLFKVNFSKTSIFALIIFTATVLSLDLGITERKTGFEERAAPVEAVLDTCGAIILLHIYL